jgi:hypothetical protein
VSLNGFVSLVTCGPLPVQKYDRNQPLTVIELRAFLARLLERAGALFEIGDDGVENNRISHVRILTGVQGDGTLEGTLVLLADPATGRNEKATFTIFDQRHGGADPVALGIGIFHF